jgi:hypothetical protein
MIGMLTTIADEGYRGIGRRERRRMIRRWKAEGRGMSLKQWAANADVGEAALVWIRHKRDT